MDTFKGGNFPHEIEEGNLEYKSILENLDETRINKLCSQMLWRISEGFRNNGFPEAIYLLGVNDDGTITGLDSHKINKTVKSIAHVVKKCKAIIHSKNIKFIKNGFIAQIIIRKIDNFGFKQEVKIAMLGGPDTGKSTLIGTLVYGYTDNGNGSSRISVFRYDHEFRKGNTSSITANFYKMGNKIFDF